MVDVPKLNEILMLARYYGKEGDILKEEKLMYISKLIDIGIIRNMGEELDAMMMLAMIDVPS